MIPQQIESCGAGFAHNGSQQLSYYEVFGVRGEFNLHDAAE
jgi:hypothetical protein